MKMEKVRRFVDVQRQMQRAEEWALHSLRREQHSLQQAQQRIFEAFNSTGDELSASLAPSLARQLSRLAADEESISAAGERQADVVLRHAARLKQAELLERKLRAEERRRREKNELGDLIDRWMGAPGARVP